MQDIALADSMIKCVLDEVKPDDQPHIKMVGLDVGELSGVSAAALKFELNSLKRKHD